MNDASRYPIILYGLKAGDFSHLETHIIEAIRQVWSDARMKPEVIQQYLGSSPHCIFTKTKNRKRVAQLTQICVNASIFMNKMDPEQMIQSLVSRKAAKEFVGDGKGDYYYPSKKLYEQLEGLAGSPIFRCSAATMKVTLKLRNHKIWRRLVIPVDINFEQFHELLQTVFGWTDSHLHDFTVYKGNRAIVNLVCDDESFDFPGNVPMSMETDHLLSEYVSPGTRITYIYDFGDNWEHEIMVESIDKDYPKIDPECLAGEGTTPPEDVGGEPGYEYYLEVMAYPHHPEYQTMAEWSGNNLSANFNLQMVNNQLKYVL
nr:plasmid pRiA4b ORF-3 family protein [Sporolactobacillus vineae]